MSILLLGQRGYIGQAFMRELFTRSTPYSGLSRHQLDYTKFGLLLQAVRAYKPELIINCAALVCKPSVDVNEQFKAETLQANLVFAETLANVCELTRTPLLHVSTGCLFNHGEPGYAYRESDQPMLTLDRGAGIYVASKEMAETVVNRLPENYICRIRLPFDEHDGERNYISKLLRYPKVWDQSNSISHRGDFVRACLDLWQLRAPCGTYHVTNGGGIWAHDICRMLADEHARDDKKFRGKFAFWDDDHFRRFVAGTLKSNAHLSNEKLLATGVKMRDVRDAVADAIKNWKPEHV